ncbi:MAG: hypothetical protein RLZZ21_1355 [Planctomycetota bacterium]|jgi:hypothetical protein
MSKIEANVSGVQGITARVVGDGIVATVSGVGPQGPDGPPGPSGASDLTITGGTVSPLVLELTQQVAP